MVLRLGYMVAISVAENSSDFFLVDTNVHPGSSGDSAAYFPDLETQIDIIDPISSLLLESTN